jgi:hypothetical protein
MTRLSAWLIDHLSWLLRNDERDAVQGDLAEMRLTGGRAVRDVLGLVIRREVALWIDWRPWLALLGLALPLGFVLSFVAHSVATDSAMYIWMYSDWWTPSFLTIPGARIELASNVGRHLILCLTLGAWAWTSGFALSSLSGRAVWVNGSVFCLVLFVEVLSLRTFGPRSSVFSLTFFRDVLPISFCTLLLVVPALWGMEAGRRRASLPFAHTLLFGVAVAGMTIVAADRIHGALIGVIVNRIAVGPYTMEQGRLMQSWLTWWPLHLVPLIVLWPAAYMTAIACWHRRQQGTPAA